LGRSAEALPKYQAALEMRQRLHKTDHPDVAIVLSGLAFCLSAQERPAEAAQTNQEAIAMFQRLLAAHPGNSSLGLSLAKVYQKAGDASARAGDTDSALEKYRKGLGLAESVLATDSTDIEAGKLRKN